MCAPTHYEVDCGIHPWMEGNVRRASREVAEEQWRELRERLANRTRVELIDPRPGLPDIA